jgi:hypothetical protein
MYCSACGKQIEDGSAFCRHCGAKQKTAAPAPVSPEETGSATSSRTPLIIVGMCVAALGLGIFAAMPRMSTPPPSAAALNIAADLEAQADALEATGKPKAGANWRYSTDEDKVRGKTTYFATTTSTNTVFQASPYEAETRMEITVRKSPAYGLDVILTVSSGQLMCPSYRGCSGTVRFDDGPPQRVQFNGAADNSSETVFVVGAKGFLAKLKKAKRVVVEKTLYQAGNPQFEFEVSGLKWEH